MTLVKGWKTWWRWWSTWLSWAGTLFLLLPEIAEHLLYAYNIIPMDIKASFSVEWSRYIGAALGILSFFSRFITQRKAKAIADIERSLGEPPKGKP